MSIAINWLHLTDLHFGIDSQGWLWPSLRKDFLRDIEYLSKNVDGWDLVFFTGDLVQSGDEVQFRKLSEELQRIWDVLAKRGRIPKLCVVPGNHDLVRPDPRSPITKSITQLWDKDPEIRRQFWLESDCDYRKLVEKSLHNYEKWLSEVGVEKIATTKGKLSGDFSATYTKDGINLGIIGLNSTFLQLSGGDFKGRLELHVSQLNDVCAGDPDTWLTGHTANLLLTHQPPSWLSPEALAHFKEQIYPAGRFIAQLCGHQHIPEAFELSEAGSLPRRLRQGPSLFGLDTWEGVHPEKRIHGYNAGQFIFDGGDGTEKYWPRIVIQGRDGSLSLKPDHSYNLQSGDCVISSFSCNGQENEFAELAETIDRAEIPKISNFSESLFEPPLNADAARDKLKLVSRLTIEAPNYHKIVRQDTQSQLEHELRKSRLVWLKADWGTGKENFLAAALERFKALSVKPEIFLFKCEEASTIEDLESLFAQQFGMPLQVFCAIAEPIEPAFFVFDGIASDLISSPNRTRLFGISEAMLDYCPKLKVIFVSRSISEDGQLPIVHLQPLDVPDVRLYVSAHPDFQDFLAQPDIIERLHEQSDGLPMHIDRMLKALKVSSVNSVLGPKAEREEGVTDREISKTLQEAVLSLSRSTDKGSQRSFRLLKVLTVLSHGETLETIGHFLPAEPFFDSNATQLKELSLLDVIILQQKLSQTGPRIGSLTQNSPKLLRVPRPVRDYVVNLIDEPEYEEIIYAGLERYFGRGWKLGKMKLRKVPIEYQDFLQVGIGNELPLLQWLFSKSKKTSDKNLNKRASSLAVFYVQQLNSQDRYRDLMRASEALIQFVDQEQSPREWSLLASEYGEGLRMMAKGVDSLVYLRGALEVGGDTLSESKKSSILVDIALAEQQLGNDEAALEAARQIISTCKDYDAYHMQASAIVVEISMEGHSKIEELKKLERKARASDNRTLADTILLDLTRAEKAPEKKVKILDVVLKTNDPGYNQARAIVIKGEMALQSEGVGDLSFPEMRLLANTYNYLYAQRFTNLFDRCHDVLWRIFEKKGDSNQLLRLFKHASFIWRVRGDEVKELKYLNRLSADGKPAEAVSSSKLGDEIAYFMRRFVALITGKSKNNVE